MAEFLRSQSDLYVGREAECKRFIGAVFWITRTGAQWRMLPAEYGRWNSVYKRFARWCERGIWERMHQHFVDDPDMENLICQGRREISFDRRDDDDDEEGIYFYGAEDMGKARGPKLKGYSEHGNVLNYPFLPANLSFYWI